MGKRKRIALFASFPETAHVRRVTDGIRIQCEKYDYDLCVFSASAHLSFPVEAYSRAEASVFDIADFGKIDGVILDPITLKGDKDDYAKNRLLGRLSQYKDLPVFSLEIPIEGTALIPHDNEEILRAICRHVIRLHNAKIVCILTGPKGDKVAEERLAIFLDELGKYGVSVLPEHIVYGDFWYTGGDRLADSIAGGEIPFPDAVVCASDYMALGLIEKLMKHGVKVPEDIIVTGFDATDEGASSRISLTSYEANDVQIAANAVDHIRKIIEPEAQITPYVSDPDRLYHSGASCGCLTDPVHAVESLRQALYYTTPNFADSELKKKVNIGILMESYALENFTASGTPDECMASILASVYLISPYRKFSLCLKENWLTDDSETAGYSDNMFITVSASADDSVNFYGVNNASSFSLSCMHPSLDEPRDKASVFYFSPVHFEGKALGYTVIEREISDKHKPDLVLRTWLRFINISLEMIRSRERLHSLSVRDEMTGLYNRRGMNKAFRKLLECAGPEDRLFVSVIDMDGLKYINDTFGHKDGDFSIKEIASAIAAFARKDEICVRGGGDEFFVIGIGSYSADNAAGYAEEFTAFLAERTKNIDKPYEISASVGCVVCGLSENSSLDRALSEADEIMYQNKIRRKKQRVN
ncbi:MAG: GGDEF domain-containing protein [Oscillospiraceae bacterium]|nr:GGDEF domain-containing protein [Oscillospiraceae bacterium]